VAGWDSKKCASGCFFLSDDGWGEMRWLEYYACRTTGEMNGSASFDVSRLDHLYGDDPEQMGGFVERFERLEAFNHICNESNRHRAAMKEAARG